jgi:parallel beta-helix repeat protein
MLVLLIEDAGVVPPGHRIQLLGMDSFFAGHREIGVGYGFNNSATFKNYWAIHTAVRDATVAAPQFLTGVVFNDVNGNRRYDLGEGLAGVTVSNGTTSVLTNGAGGWSMFVTPGVYTVTASGGSLVGAPSAKVTVASNVNVEVDFISGFPIGEVNFSRQSGAGVLAINCPTASLQDAVNAALPGQTVLVGGTCNENVLIRNEKQRVTIDGSGGGVGTKATINAPGGSPGLNVRGKGIVIQNFIISGGNDGVVVNRGSNAVLNNNVIQSTGGDGVRVEQLSFAVLTNNTIANNPGDGVSVEDNSTARIGFNADSDTVASINVIQNNGGRGIKVDNGAHARIIGNTISGNNQQGIAVERDSSADIASNVINGNQADGIKVESNSFVMLGEDTGVTIYETPNSTSVNNGGAGIRCDDGAVVDGRLGTLNGNGGATDIHSTCVNSLI